MHTVNNPDQALRKLVDSNFAVQEDKKPSFTSYEAALAVVGLRVQVSPLLTDGEMPIEAYRPAWVRRHNREYLPGLPGLYIADGKRVCVVGTIIGLHEFTPYLEWSELGRRRIGRATLATLGPGDKAYQTAMIHQVPGSWFLR